MNGLREALEGPDLEIEYTIGDAFSGRTELSLRDDGTYRASSTATTGRRLVEFSGTVEPPEVERIVSALKDARVWEAEHVRAKPREDDPEATVAVRSPRASGEVRLWVSEIARVPQFAAAQDALLEFARGVSDGAILERGR
jgi:hypothetical protein